MAAFVLQTAVGLSSAPLKATTQPFTCGVEITPLSANTGKIFLGFSSGVTTATGKEVPLTGIFIPSAVVGDCLAIHLISDTAAQGVSSIGF